MQVFCEIDMTKRNIRTATLSSFEEYLTFEYTDETECRAVEVQERMARLESFPYSVVLQVAYPELDFANRWCWQQFGAPNGACLDKQSEYSTCELEEPYEHKGMWFSYWLGKTDYDFGYNEWNFQMRSDLDRFLEFISEINWGENYPK